MPHGWRLTWRNVEVAAFYWLKAMGQNSINKNTYWMNMDNWNPWVAWIQGRSRVLCKYSVVASVCGWRGLCAASCHHVARHQQFLLFVPTVTHMCSMSHHTIIATTISITTIFSSGWAVALAVLPIPASSLPFLSFHLISSFLLIRETPSPLRLQIRYPCHLLASETV